MRHLRPYLALLAIAAISAACSAAPGSSTAENQPSTGSQPSQVAASSGGGGGGGGGGANGSATYEITGDATKSGELAFTYINGGISQFIDSGWVAYFYSADQQTIIQVNSQQGTNIVNFGDGEVLIVGTEADGSCTFDFSQNDSSGLKGTIDCSDPIATKVATTSERIHVKLHVTLDAHT